MNHHPEHRLACAMLTCLVEPADPLMGRLLSVLTPAGMLASIWSGAMPAGVADGLDQTQVAGLRRSLARWRAQLPAVPPDGGLAAGERHGIRLVCPGDPGWPLRLDDLGTARPYALWVRGRTDLAVSWEKSLAVVGARAATAYGTHIAAEIAADLAGRGWVIVSGAAYGIDAAAHHGALIADGRTIAVLACGPDIAYPSEHRGLIAALACGGTIVVEAAARSGTLATARHASDLDRPLMAVPGLVTSTMSAGCHTLIREQRATLVTSAAEIIADIGTSCRRRQAATPAPDAPGDLDCPGVSTQRR